MTLPGDLQDSRKIGRFQRVDVAMTAYLLVLALANVWFLAAIYPAFGQFEDPIAVAALAILGAVAERSRVRLSSILELSISLLPTLFAAVTFGPLEAMIVGAASMVGDFRRPYLRWAVYTLSGSLTGAATALVAGGILDRVDSELAGIALATVAGAAVAQTVDTAFAAATVTIRGTGSAVDIARTLAPVVVASVPLYTPVVGLLSYAYVHVSPWTLPLFIAPAVTAQHLFGLYQRQRKLAEDLTGANRRLERANVSFATALVTTLDARDHYTAGHSAAVATYSRDIAKQMGCSPHDQQLVHLCGLVHDIGKVGLPAGLVEKPGPLTLQERRRMQDHSMIGERILRQVDSYEDIATIVRHHHERVDGHGYPDGLEGSCIPLLAQIIAVADAYNAMTSNRPYRDAMPSATARLRLAQAVGSQFDIDVVAAFEAILSARDQNYRVATGPAFTFSLGAPSLDSEVLDVA